MGRFLIFLIFILSLHVDAFARDSDEVSVFSFAEDMKKVQKEKKDEKKQDITDKIKEIKKEETKIQNVPLEQKTEVEKQDFKDKNLDTFTNQTFSPKTLFASYKEMPLSGYVGEIIPLSIRVIATEEFDNIDIKYDNPNGTIFVFNPKWRKDSDNTYENTIYFQPKEPMEILPKFKVSIDKNGKEVESSYLKPTKLNIVKLGDDDGRFINVFAKNLTVKKFKTTQFNDSALIMILELQTSQASFNHIKFNNVIKQGIDSKAGVFPDITLYYFLIFKNETSSIKFSYFNTSLNRFEIIELPVIVEQDDLSTQIGLNPKKSKYELYKDVGLGFLIVILLGLFLYYKKYVFAVLAIILSLYLFYVRGTTTLNIKAKSKIRILPTEKSTIFYTISSPMQVEELNRVNSYIKVLLPNNKIGWIKEEDVIKN